ncbi:MAG: DUF2399 domain-containing protein [Fusobacteriaceae bacterium]
MYKEIITLIKKDPCYKEIFDKILKHYNKTGKLTGIIRLENISKKCEVFLSSISKNNNNIISFKVENFFSYFKSEKYKKLNSETLMKEIYKDNFFYLGDIKKREVEKKEIFFSTLPLREWWENSDSTLIKSTYNESPQKLLEYVSNIEKALEYIKKEMEEHKIKYTPLSVISAQITRDSHYFDSDTIPGKLLLDYLWFLSKSKKSKKIEDVSELLLSFYIVKDEFFNFTLAYNLFGRESWTFIWKEKQPLNISLYNLRDVKKITSIEQKVFIFENPAVFRDILEKLEQSKIKRTLLCTSGQLNVSSLVILDRLVESNSHLYYSGDFDPEGLQIAQKLKFRYKDNISFFNMTVEDYYYCIGNNSIETRLNKLESIEIKEFEEVVTAMKKDKMAGYQEVLIDKYFKYIKNKL